MNDTTDPKPRPDDGGPFPWRVSIALVALAAALPFAFLSCGTVGSPIVMLPDVPGAEYLGSTECAQCHADIYKTFQTADHARLIARGANAFSAGCESCHGPSSLHAQSGGETRTPYGFSAGRPQANLFGGSPTTPADRAVETVCFQCHADVRGQFSLPNHHPLPEGKMTCTECHPPHKGSAHLGGSTALRARDETCLKCHPAQRGPHVFEHEAMREGCTICHGPHGTVNAKLLTERDSNLCLKCHFQRVQGNNIVIGGSIHSGLVNRLQQGTCWTAGCHEAVHGSRASSSLRF